MNNETLRIMKMVEQGKLSAEEALELLEALGESKDSKSTEEPKEEPTAEAAAAAEEAAATEKDQLGKFVSQLEGLTKNVAKNVNWSDISKQVNEGVNKGLDALKKATDEARKSGTFTQIFGAESSRIVDLPLEVPVGKVFRVEGQHADIKLMRAEGNAQVTVEASFRAPSAPEAEAKAEQFFPNIQESDQTVLLRLPEGHDAHVQVTAYIPANTPVEIKTAKGDIEMEMLFANARIETQSGDVMIVGAKGNVDVTVASGDVRLHEIDASLLTVDATSGDVTLDRVSGVCNVRTGSGNVHATEIKGRTLSIETASGEAYIKMAEPVQGALNVRTVSGDIAIEVPDGGDCRVSLSTLRGETTCKLELDEVAQDKATITGKIGSGRGTLTASAVSGDVVLELRDSTAE